MGNEKTYKVVRKWADNKWHTEAGHLTLRRARNLYFRLLQDVIGIMPSNLRIICEQDIFDVIVDAVDCQVGGITV